MSLNNIWFERAWERWHARKQIVLPIDHIHVKEYVNENGTFMKFIEPTPLCTAYLTGRRVTDVHVPPNPSRLCGACETDWDRRKGFGGP